METDRRLQRGKSSIGLIEDYSKALILTGLTDLVGDIYKVVGYIEERVIGLIWK